MKNRSALRAEAKRLYKEQIKGIPKRQRLPFAEFFKQYKALKLNKTNQNEIDESIFVYHSGVCINCNNNRRSKRKADRPGKD